MNTKKSKGKKPNKSPNPNPQPEIVKVPEIVDDVEKVESELKIDERVPEIISEVVKPLEIGKTDVETPKKPKRNRGKKKKQDRDSETEDNQEEKAALLPVPLDEKEDKEPKDTVEIKKEEETNKEVLESIVSEAPETHVTATARKKKNKKKGNQEIPADKEKIERDIKDTGIEVVKAPEVATIKAPDAVKAPELPTVKATDVPTIKAPEISAEVTKPIDEIIPGDVKSKKKNKKKKRNDSEKSDKTEEISSTVIQDILNIEDDKSSKNVDKLEIIDNIIQVTCEVITEEKKETKLEPEDSVKEDDFKVSGKNKKKNKKNKNETAKHDEGRSDSKCEDISQDKPCASPDVTSSDVVIEKPDSSKILENVILQSDDVKILKEDVILSTSKPSDDDNTTSKAKIAKPVEKKRKDKSQKEVEHETEKESLIDVPKPKEEVITVPLEIKEVSLHEKTKPKEEVKQSASMPLEIKEVALQEESKPKEVPLLAELKDEAILTSLVELINMPQTGMGKKRKKSPKPPTEKREMKSEIKQDKLDVKEKTDIRELKSEIKDIAEVEMDIPKSILKEPCAVVTAETIEQQPAKLEVESLFPDRPTSSKMEIKPPKEVLDTPSKVSLTDVLHDKPGKKRKKSPKPPTKLEKIEAKYSKEEQKHGETEQKQTEHVKESTENVEESDIFIDMPPMEYIETGSSIKIETEGSNTAEDIKSIKTEAVSEEIPCIQNPDSQGDNNNNIIQEIITADSKLSIPIVIPDTPFIKDSVASPVLTCGIKIPEDVSVVKSDPEKTDIKSKMMEVNQDMEELRLSIERSLAELTSIEKSEEKIEKQFEQAKINKPAEDSPVSKAEQFESNIKDGKNKPKLDKKPLLEQVIPAPSLPMPSDIVKDVEQMKPLIADENKPVELADIIPLPPPMPIDIGKVEEKLTSEEEEIKPAVSPIPDTPPVCPARKDHKGKGKSKKKGKQEVQTTSQESTTTIESTTTKDAAKEEKKEEKSEQRTEKTQEKGKQQSDIAEENKNEQDGKSGPQDFEPIENFEDAMTSSVDDVNKTFEMIASEAQVVETNLNPEIKVIAPLEDKVEKRDEKVNPVSQPKNLLGHPVIPVRSNKMDYKKEKNKTQNALLAKVKIKDSVQIENKQSKESQTENIKKFTKKDSDFYDNEEFVYKYSFRKVFLPSVCHICKKDLKQCRVACSYCNLLFYCSNKHKDEDWPQHQALCFAVSTIVHLKDQKHIYEDAKNITGQNYRLLRMQMIVSCEKILKRKLVPWEQEVLLYPRMCADLGCREWRQNKLVDCDGCGQLAYCFTHPDHLPKSHQRWCKSYSLYQKLVCYQQTKGRLEPKLPGRVIKEHTQIPEKINEVLASMYNEKIDMNDVEYAALTQLATAPLTAVYGFQTYTHKMNSIYANGTYKKTSFTIHVVGAELQFEADALNKWEVFFLHLRPDIKDLRVCLVSTDLNPSNLPLDLLGKVKVCETCRQDKRRLLFSFQDKTYPEYYRSDDFAVPDIVCTFNSSIQRSSAYYGKDTWPSTITAILKQKVPFIITAYTMEELSRDLDRIRECSKIEFNIISEPKNNSFSSVRPDRNFISDDEMPLLFKNYCFVVVCGVF